MKYFRIETDYDAKNNSPWDTLSYKKKYDELECLSGSFALAPIWSPPAIKLESRKKCPGMYVLLSNFAVTEKVRDWMRTLIRREVEFLPLDLPDTKPLYVIHPLWPVDFDTGAIVRKNSVSGNITRVEKYSFKIDPERHVMPRHFFRIRQAEGSSGRAGGYTLPTLIVSEKFKRLCERRKLKGVRFVFVHEIEEPDTGSDVDD
jgi:hypothetical protein